MGQLLYTPVILIMNWMEYLDDCVWTMVPGVQTLRFVEVSFPSLLFSVVRLSSHQEHQYQNSYDLEYSGYRLTRSWFLFSEIQCRDPDAFEGVLFKVSTHSVGGIAHYSCPRGHSLQGNSSRVCLKNGAWDGKTPTCIRK